MPKGWRGSLFDKRRLRHFIVGVADLDDAKYTVAAQYPGSSGIVLLPLKDGDFEKMGLVDGQVIESTKLG